MKTKTWIVGMLSMGMLNLSFAKDLPKTTLEDTQGRKIEAILLASDNTTVTFKRVGAEKTYTLSLDKLTEDTQDALLAFNLPAEVEEPKEPEGVSVPKDSFLPIKFSSGKTSKRTSPGTYDDERKETLKPVVSIENRDSGTPLRCEMTVAVFGRGAVDKRQIKVLAKKTFSLKLPGGESDTFSIEEFSILFNIRDGYNHGFKYQGYAVILHDKEGQVLRTVASPTYEEIPRDVLKVQKGKVYDTGLNKEVKPPR